MAAYIAQKIEQDFEIDGDVRKVIWNDATWSEQFVDMATGGVADFETHCCRVRSFTSIFAPASGMLVKLHVWLV